MSLGVIEFRGLGLNYCSGFQRSGFRAGRRSILRNNYVVHNGYKETVG